MRYAASSQACHSEVSKSGVARTPAAIAALLPQNLKAEDLKL
jgi:hypothetical protein